MYEKEVCMKEEENIFKKAGKDNHFTVPEGYFENLPAQVMNILDDVREEPVKIAMPTRWDKMKPWIYMVAMFIGAAFIIRIASWRSAPAEDNGSINTTHRDTEIVSDEYIDEILDISVMDDYSLYLYLTDAGVGYE
ncbi:hypothetical protein EZS27_025018 [termite gut metagenome]|uniref:Uncharacterized protein n=1 Tax=termite gut metagenome TaxID=433724 RepID=A0A5J4QV58_9ZZZZ